MSKPLIFLYSFLIKETVSGALMLPQLRVLTSIKMKYKFQNNFYLITFVQKRVPMKKYCFILLSRIKQVIVTFVSVVLNINFL